MPFRARNYYRTNITTSNQLFAHHKYFRFVEITRIMIGMRKVINVKSSSSGHHQLSIYFYVMIHLRQKDRPRIPPRTNSQSHDCHFHRFHAQSRWVLVEKASGMEPLRFGIFGSMVL